jgi:hypothetical protein
MASAPFPRSDAGDGQPCQPDAGQQLARAIDIVVELFLEDGTSLGTYTKRLAMWENHQINRVFEKVTKQKVDKGYAVVWTTRPAGTFHAIASVVDNITGVGLRHTDLDRP